jgi:hypothetical protein
VKENGWRLNPEFAKEWTEFFKKQVPQCSVQEYWFLLQGPGEAKRFLDAFWEATGDFFRGKKIPKKEVNRALENTIKRFKIYPFEDRGAKLAKDVYKKFCEILYEEIKELGISIPYDESDSDDEDNPNLSIPEVITLGWEKHNKEVDEAETRIDEDTSDEYNYIKSLSKQGHTVREIAEKTDKSKSTIGRILKKIS